jgi:DNA-binding transcriptional ArsR family regulator
MRTVNPDNPKRLAVLALVRENPSITIVEIRRATGMSRGAVYHHLINLDNEGAIHRNTLRGNYKHKPHSIVVKKLRKEVPAEKRSEYARRGRGNNAFVPRKQKRNDALQARIDMVVKKALMRENNIQHDVVRHVNGPLRMRGAHKIG